jgi:hypothetical protein
MIGAGMARVTAWFASQGREPFAFQRETWDAYLHGQSVVAVS